MNRAARILLLLVALVVLAAASGALLVRRGALGDTGWLLREEYAQRRAIVEARLRGDRVLRDVAYVERPGWTGRLDLYLPADSSPAAPVVIYFHGGGWYGGNRRLAALAATDYRRHGFAVANVSYRLTSEGRAPAAIEDARCAVRWVAANGAALGLDPSRIVTVGASAGGHVALMAALLRESHGFDRGCPGHDARAAATINWFGPTDLTRLLAHPDARGFTALWLGDSAASATFQARMSPVTHLRGDGPAIVTIHGARDPLVPVEQGRLLHERLAALGATHRLLVEPEGVHSFDGASTRALTDSALAFLRPHLGRAGGSR